MPDFHVVDPEVYRRHRDDVVALSNSVQVDINEFLPAGVRKRGLSDVEIAERLGLDVRDVREIRVVAERDAYPLEEFGVASVFKEKACRAFAEKGRSHVFDPGYTIVP
jgi:hypothetical protein